MELIRDFAKLDKNDVALAGGKGASLGEMTRAGIPVPMGFVVLSTAFEKFLEETDLNVEIDSILHSVNHKEMHTIENASEKIKALILVAEIPIAIIKEIQKFFKNLNSKYVAARSSATAEDSASAAWAGQLESYLNTTEQNLLENVKKCWASLFTPRAIFYRFEKDLHKQKISVAVVVQKMVESEKSGIAFSVHPVTQDKNQLIIEAGFGLGEAIVSGQITPDSYVVEKNPRRIIDKNVQTQTKALYRAKNGGNEWRDIPKAQGEKQVLSDKEIEELSETILRIESHYGFPCDIEWTAEKKKFYVVQSRPITTLNSDISKSYPNIRKEDYVKSVRRPYPPLFSTLICAGFSNENYYSNLMTEFHAYCKNIIISEGVWYYNKAEKERSAIDTFSHWKEAKILSQVQREFDSREKELLAATKKDFASFSKVWEPHMATVLVLVVEGLVEKQIRTLLSEKQSLDEVDSLMGEINSPLKDNFYKREEYDLVQAENLDEHVKRYEWFVARYGQRISYTKKQAAEHLARINKNEFLKERDTNKEKLERSIMRAKKILGENAHLIDFFQYIIYYRTQRSDIMNKAIYLAMPMLDKTAAMTGLTYQQLLHCTKEEILSNAIPPIDTVEQRIKKHAIVVSSGKIHCVIGRKCDEITEIFTEDVSAITEFRGNIACKGLVEGRAKIIVDRSDFDKVQQGDIIVTSMTTPEMVEIMNIAAAFVTNEGGVTCHAAIIARELKKPCIIGTQIATYALRDGDLVKVDANSGIVKILK